MSFVFSGVQVASFAAAAFCTLVLPVVLLIVLVQIFQSVGTRLSVKSDKRLKGK